MRLVPWRKPQADAERDMGFTMSFQQWMEMTNYNGVFYSLPNQTLRNDREEIASSFTGLAAQAYAANAVVFACMETRRSAFSEVRFIFRGRKGGRPGTLFGTPELAPLENPWESGTTGDLLSRMIQDVDLAGNSYTVRNGDRLARLRPDWVAIVLGSLTGRSTFVPGDPDTKVVGYVYYPGGKNSGVAPIRFLPEQVAHFAPIPDPLAAYRGMSWLTALVREIEGDSMMTAHKTKFLEQGATVNLVVKYPQGTSRENFDAARQVIDQRHSGWEAAYRTLHIAGGADVTAIGSNFQQMDFQIVQGAGETRIAAAARVHPVIAGFTEGLKGSSLNAGNYQSARRQFADHTLRPLWRNAAGSLANIINVPGGAELWYDDRDVAFLKEDLTDEATVMQLRSTSAKTLIDAGFDPDSVVTAIDSNDFSQLSHTGLVSVQLQPPGTTAPDTSGGTANGTANGKAPPVPALTGGK